MTSSLDYSIIPQYTIKCKEKYTIDERAFHMNEKRKDVGKRIREARKAMRLSQSELSEQLNISPSHMSDIENGKINVGLDIFMRLTEILCVSADWLLQTDTPFVNTILNEEVANLLSNCTLTETKAMLKIMREIKSSFDQITSENKTLSSYTP